MELNQFLKVLAAELTHKTKHESLPVGVHTLDGQVTLLLQGGVIKNPRENYTPTADIPLLAVLARFAQKAGVVGPRLLEMLQEACTEALEQGEPCGDYIEHTKEALRLVREKVTSKLPQKEREGATRRALAVTVTDFVPTLANLL